MIEGFEVKHERNQERFMRGLSEYEYVVYRNGMRLRQDEINAHVFEILGLLMKQNKPRIPMPVEGVGDETAPVDYGDRMRNYHKKKGKTKNIKDVEVFHKGEIFSHIGIIGVSLVLHTDTGESIQYIDPKLFYQTKQWE